jgi:SAM-dependent methyltransferase
MGSAVSRNVNREDVKQANRRLYDTIASDYESLDGRRSPSLKQWLRSELVTLRGLAPGGTLLDIGSGGGLVTDCAAGVFEKRVALDLSQRMLALNRERFNFGIVADVDAMPIRAGSVDVVTCFATLHHLFDFHALVPELARILRPGGVFYSDHDLDRRFRARFGPALAIYRRARNSASHWQAAGIEGNLYQTSEWQAGGIDAVGLREVLVNHGFAVTLENHWYGLHPWSNRLFGRSGWPSGWAPLARIRAVAAAEQSARPIGGQAAGPVSTTGYELR